MRKRIASLLIGGVLVAGSALGMTACKDSGGKSNKLVLWGPGAQTVSLKQMVAQFLEENPDFGLEIEVGVAGEGDAYSMMSNDPKSGADVFAYANDQSVNLYSIGALARLSTATVDELKETNSLASVEAGKIGEGYYGYPYAADNGFFMYYDKSVISEEETHNLEDVLAACAKAKKYIIYQFGTGWYVGSFMYGAGGSYSVTYEGTTVSDIQCNFDQEKGNTGYTYGEIGGQQLIDFYNANDYVVNGGDEVLPNYLNDKKGNCNLGACITGTWNAGIIEAALKDNYAATILPDWTSSLTGETYRWKSFAGYKLYGVNSFSKHLPEAHKLAAFLSSAEMQEKRFDDNQIGPSNLNVAAMDKVKDNVAIAAISEQLKPENSVIQTAMPKSYWDEMESFGGAMNKWEGTPAELLQRVKDLVTALKVH